MGTRLLGRLGLHATLLLAACVGGGEYDVQPEELRSRVSYNANCNANARDMIAKAAVLARTVSASPAFHAYPVVTQDPRALARQIGYQPSGSVS